MTKPVYEIKTIDSMDELDRGSVAVVDTYNWGGEYRPKVFATLCYVRDKGFGVRLWCEEKNPRAVFTEPNSGVCRDSCLEFFADFKPETGKGYVNFEGNSIGTMLCFLGPDRFSRKPVVELGVPHPQPKAFKTDDTWGWELFIPLSFIETLYGDAKFEKGSHIRANFYKCGDDCEVVHYASFTKIESENPDYHRPEAFAEMEIV